MADELDPRLEARLREALHADGDALPLLIREQDVLRARRRRRGRRLAVPASLLGAAAMVAILVAVGALRVGEPTDVGATPSPSPSPSERPLASYEELLGLIGPGATAALQGEGKTPGGAGGAVETDLGTVLVTPTLKLAVSCLGGELTVALRANGEDFGTHRIHCSLQRPFPSTVDPFAATPAVEARVVVIAPKGMRWRIAVADPFESDPSPDPSTSQLPVFVRPSPGSGETPLTWLEVGLGSPEMETGLAVPDGTDEILVTGRCAGEGELRLEIDGVRGDYPCAAIGGEVFIPDNTWLDIRASATGSAYFAISIVARDLERVEGVAWIPPALTLEGSPVSGTAASRTAYAGCGLSWQPASGGGFVDDCGPSWQPIGAALRVAPGTTVSLSLANGWAIEDVAGSIAAQDQVLARGRNPESQPFVLRKTADGFDFQAPEPGDWSLRLTVSGGKDGDRFRVPYYARVIVTP